MLREARDTFAARGAILLLAVLLLLDAMFITAHVLHVFYNDVAMFRDPRFAMETDRGYSEWYEYLKTAVCILALAACYRISSQPVYGGLSVVWCLILADNALRLHERIGRWLSRWFAPAKQLFESAPQAIGELAVFAALGLLALAILVRTLPRSSAGHQVRGGLFVILILFLAGFGVGVDLLHAVSTGSALDPLIGAIEDGGELILLSTCCVAAVMLYRRMAAGQPALSPKADAG